MKQTINLLTMFSFLILMVNFFSSTPVWSQTLREPAYAGSFYPADPVELNRFIKDLTAKAGQTPADVPRGKSLKALILPHAGYVYSGLTVAHAGQVLKNAEFSKIILMGPDHRVGFQHAAISAVDAYKTPLGIVGLHEDAKTLLKKSDLFQSNPLSDQREHCIEVALPFLQYYLKDFKIIPMVMGRTDPHRYLQAVESIMDSQTLIVVSSDLSHYLPYEEAVATDTDTLDKIVKRDTEGLSGKPDFACGKIPILLLIRMAEKYGWQPVRLHYSNSGDTAGTRDRVVGYGAVAFFGDHKMEEHSPMGHFTEEQGQLLVRVARRTICKTLGKETAASPAEETALTSDIYKEQRGTFVTLKKNGQLRGCIGSLSSYEPIMDGIRQNALNAAFRDPRFRPLSADELDQVTVEVSILTDPKPLEYKDGEDLIRKLRVNVDGVILRKGAASATFLPQVWEQLPDPRHFLSQLCLKAGLARDAWNTSKLEISTYQVEYFEEK